MLARPRCVSAFASSSQSAVTAFSTRSSIRPAFLLLQQQYLPLSHQKQQGAAIQIRRNTSAVRVVHNDRVNGPASTLPPVLVLPDRSFEESIFKYLFKLGKGYASFYKSGVKAIYTNYKLNKELNPNEPPKTRHDFQLQTRVRHDLRRIPPFVLVFAICGEFTPLLIPFLSALVPGTCKIPKQIARDRNKLESHRQSSFNALQLANAAREGVEQFPDSVQTLDPQQARHISTSLYLHARMLDILAMPPTSVLQRRIDQRLAYLSTDDKLLIQDGGVSGLEADELAMACVDRGIATVDKSQDAMRKDLQTWLDQVSGSASYEREALRRWLTPR